MGYIVTESGEKKKVEYYQRPPPQVIERASDLSNPKIKGVLDSMKERKNPIELKKEAYYYDEEDEDEADYDEEDDYPSRRRKRCGKGNMWLILILALVAIGIGIMLMRKHRNGTSSSSSTAEMMPTGGKTNVKFY